MNISIFVGAETLIDSLAKEQLSEIVSLASKRIEYLDSLTLNKEEYELASMGDKIKAIMAVRLRLGLSLRQAKGLVESV